MIFNRLHRPLAIVALAGLAACSGGTNANTQSPIPGAPTIGGGYAQNIVGVGDSLTAGTQSGTTMGLPGSNPLSPLPGGLVPPTQENGWFALFFAQANGIKLDPAQYNLDTALGAGNTSPLPLINSPGLGTQLLLSTSGSIFGTHLSCDSFDASAYSLNTVGQVRANLQTKIYDLGVPGITTHESLTMTAPLTGPPPPPAANGTCPSYPAIPGDQTSGALQSLVQSESENFYPVLGSFATTVKPLTQMNVALSLRPSLTTVWLGANDLLKYIFSAGLSPATDTPTQFATDLTSIITQLKASGSKVLIADLPTVLQTPQFFQGGVQPVPSQSVYYYLQAFSKGAISPAQAAAVVGALSQPEPAGCGVGPNGYLTESGLFGLLSIVSSGQFTGTSCQIDPTGAGSGLGSAYLTDAFAAQVSALNAGYNAVIDQVAASTSTPVVPVNAAFTAIYNASNTAPYKYVVDANGDTVDLRFGGGLVSLDGLHPSTVGYALIANMWIQTANSAFGMGLTPLNIATFYPYDPYRIPGF